VLIYSFPDFHLYSTHMTHISKKEKAGIIPAFSFAAMDHFLACIQQYLQVLELLSSQGNLFVPRHFGGKVSWEFPPPQGEVRSAAGADGIKAA
jgi:hypothetical protein